MFPIAIYGNAHPFFVLLQMLFPELVHGLVFESLEYCECNRPAPYRKQKPSFGCAGRLLDIYREARCIVPMLGRVSLPFPTQTYIFLAKRPRV